MNIDSSVVRHLLLGAALGHFATIPVLAWWSRLGILRRADLRQLAPINYRIVMVVMGTMQFLLLSSGATVLWSLDDLLASTHLAIATTASLAVLWLWRLVVQVVVYAPLFSTRLTRATHHGLVGLFAFMALSYALACASAVQVGRGAQAAATPCFSGRGGRVGWARS